MYEPKYVASRRHHPRRFAVAALTALMAAALSVHPGYAFLSHRTGVLDNGFSLASEADPGIRESFDGSVKSNVTVTNTGAYPCYIRAAISVALLDEDGNVAAKAPSAGSDYSMTLSGAWQQGSDGYYYCPTPVNPGQSTPVLISGCTSLSDEYRLEVTILSQSVQARPTRAVADAWGVTVLPDGTIRK